MGLTGSELFTPELQDRMAREHLRMSGYDAYLRGEITEAQLQQKLSGGWTSIATPAGTPRNRLDPMRTDTATIQAEIARAKAEADRVTGGGRRLDPQKPAWR